MSLSENPADIISRGSLPNDLIKSHMWWHGPTFLHNPDDQWPNCKLGPPQQELLEQRTTCMAVTSTSLGIINNLLNKFSKIDKIAQIVAYCIRFLRPKRPKPTTLTITHQETSNSLNVLCREIQKQAFNEEYNSLLNKREISKSSNLLTLTPFLDENGLIRVGGRLKNSSLSHDASHQIVLPRSHKLTRLIIESEHQRNLHSGLHGTIAAVRQRFWPLSLRSVTRSVINKCIICFKARSTFSEALIGSLPTARVSISKPFTHCGVDYAGPITLREGKRRNSRIHKAYMAVFVCFSTKVVHLELVSDLTTDAFLASLKRLISRRGKPSRIYSDNATNFVDAKRHIGELYDFLNTKQAQESINHFLRDQQTTWSFIPPNAPHFGGLWEAAVKSAKFHLTRIVGTANLTFEEMQTVLCEIEAIMNSRPLVPLSSDPNDLIFLSPGHFLVGAPLNSLPTTDLSDLNTTTLLRWQLLEQMRQHF